jgi:hypothetical protein
MPIVRPRLTALVAAALALPCAFAQAPPDAGFTDEPPPQVRARPAPVGGLWCGVGLLHKFSLQISQQHQQFDARLERKGRVREVTGRIEGSTLHTDPQRNVTLVLQAMGDRLRILDGTGRFALARGQAFARASGASCGA